MSVEQIGCLANATPISASVRRCIVSNSVVYAKKDSQTFGWLSFLYALEEVKLRTADYEPDERSSLGLNGLALPDGQWHSLPAGMRLCYSAHWLAMTEEER